jgi:hypothetical protein
MLVVRAGYELQRRLEIMRSADQHGLPHASDALLMTY